ncbi:hypothetical protein E6W39_15415 [Kitasatospora acidiphila]|uniref:Lipoprotein n=1 Tax=Kitasatospora acidiphila TaxID=2567942 RepID=A0A540W303_9ACTN|nr:hypothetical protein [Kitasatospora acidiphila]TQF03363.1 hypothetical protein E6W39_15415 [Kitasatospora acidiphila]
MFSHRLVHSAVLCIALAGTVTACGGAKGGSSGQAAAPVSATASSSVSASASATASGLDPYHLSARQILHASGKVMSGLSSMHVSGTATSDGQQVTLDLSADKAKDCTGKVTVSGTGAMDVLHNSAGTWVRPDAAVWQSMAKQAGVPDSGPAVAELFKGRWLTGGDADPDLQETVGMCGLISDMADSFSKDGTNAIVGDPTTIKGTPVISLLVSDGGSRSTLYIATQGQPYLLRVESNDSDPGTMDLGDFNKPLDVQAPPADQVIDYSQFQQKAKSA